MQKVRDPGILDARKFLRNQVLAESFGLFLRTFLVGSKVKTKNRVINLRSFENLTQKLNYITTTTQTWLTKSTCKNRRTAFLQKVFGLKPQDARNTFDFLHHCQRLWLRPVNLRLDQSISFITLNFLGGSQRLWLPPLLSWIRSIESIENNKILRWEPESLAPTPLISSFIQRFRWER